MNAVVTMPTWLPTQRDNIISSALPSWLIDFKRQQWETFMQNGMPTRHDERWKYTDLSFLTNKKFVVAKYINTNDLEDVILQYRLRRGESILLVFINGYFMPLHSDLAKLPADVIACNLTEASQKHENLFKSTMTMTLNAKHYPFASLNAALSIDGLFFHLPDQCELAAPLHVLSLIMDQDEFIAHPRNVIMLGKHSKLSLIEEHFSIVEHTYMVNNVTTIMVDQEAKLDYCKIQHEGRQAIHMANTFIQQAKNSSVTITNFSHGAQFARDDIAVQLQESGADCKTGGFYRLDRDNQYVDYHINIEHQAPHSNSEMLYKGILDKKSRAVFNGRLAVQKDAQKILAYQANHNLLLSKEAEVYSKPELEIYADDVKCKHGATTGQIDEDALFYLRSRGIDKDRAMNMLLQGFADEIIARITHPGVQLRVQELLACL